MATRSLDRPVRARGASSGAQAAGAGRIDAVQVLRALAAAMVVLLHTQIMVHLNAARHGMAFAQITGFPLGAGVDLFFVISGFIIVVASERLFGTPARAEFLRRRILRIVPLFWLALGLRLVVLAAGSATGQKTFPAATTILASFLFIPCDGMGFGPNYPFPILDLGWSLDYEMLFYAIMACLIVLSRERAVAALVLLLLAGAVASTIAPPTNMALRFWTHPLTLEFAGGALLALAYRRGVRLAPPICAALAVAGLAWWVLLPLTHFEPGSAPGSYSWTRIATDGVGAVLLVAAAGLGRAALRGRFAQPLVRLGDSSYSLYLIHPFVLLVLGQVVARLPLTPAALWPLAIATLAAAMLVAHAIHLGVERPIIRRLQAWTDPHRPPRRLIVDG